MDQKELLKYLATGEAPGAISISVEKSVAVEEPNPIDEVIVGLMAVGFLAKDLHYRAKGKAFYAVHLLSDLVWQVRGKIDELIEVYYLGELLRPPRSLGWFAELAAHKAKDFTVSRPEDEDGLLSALCVSLEFVSDRVEKAKEMALRSGTNASLDEISKSALQSLGLLKRTEKTEASEEQKDA